MKLTQVRKSIYEELNAYPRREYTAVRRRWLYLGLFGGHRAYLGQDRMATLMALSFGGLGVWWLKDRLKLAKMTDDWNADQAHRQANGLQPKEVDGLVLVTPETLESPPAWTDNPLDKILGLLFTLPVVLMAAMGNILKPVLEKVPIIGPFYLRIFRLQVYIMEKSLAVSETIQLAMVIAMASFVATRYGAIEVSLLLFGVCSGLAFTHRFLARADSRLGRQIIEWDYLLCAYYHQKKPDSFLVGYFKSAILFYPRIFGFGPEGEQKLFNRLTGTASMVCFMLIPMEILLGLAGGNGFSVNGFITGTVIGLFISVSITAMYAPVICSSLTRYKLKGEHGALQFSGGIGAMAAMGGAALALLL